MNDPALRKRPDSRFRPVWISGPAIAGLVLSIVLAFLLAPAVSAQVSAEDAPDPWLAGASIGIPGEGTRPNADLMTLALQAVRLEPGRLGAELTVGIMPRSLVHGTLGVGARAGAVLPIELSEQAFLLPSVGTGLVAGIGSSGGSAIPGVNAGASVVAFGEGATGFRAGMTWHRLRGSRSALWLLEFGFVR